MDAPTTTTLHCMRGHAPTAQCLCKLQKLSVILEASKLDAFEYSSATDTLTIYDNCLNVLERVEDFLQNVDYDSSIDAEYRPTVKQFMSGDVSKPVHSSGIRFQTGAHVHCLLQGMTGSIGTSRSTFHLKRFPRQLCLQKTILRL